MNSSATRIFLYFFGAVVAASVCAFLLTAVTLAQGTSGSTTGTTGNCKWTGSKWDCSGGTTTSGTTSGSYTTSGGSTTGSTSGGSNPGSKTSSGTTSGSATTGWGGVSAPNLGSNECWKSPQGKYVCGTSSGNSCMWLGNRWDCPGVNTTGGSSTGGAPSAPSLPMPGDSQTNAVPTPSKLPCSRITVDSLPSLPQGFGAPVDFFGSERKESLAGECARSSSVGAPPAISITAGVPNDDDMYVYQNGYYFDNGWKPVNFSGKDKAGAWYVGSASASVPVPSLSAYNQDRYVVAYTCKRTTNGWKCGCRNQQCASPTWQLQSFKLDSDGISLLNQSAPPAPGL